MMMSPVVAAYGGVWQARVTRAVDAVGVRVQFDGAASAAGVSDITAQHLQDTIQRGAAVQDWLWCILGRRRIQEVEGGDLDSELHVTWRSRNRTFVMFLSKIIHSDDAFTVKVLQAGSVSGVIFEVGLTAAALSDSPLYFCDSSVSTSSSTTLLPVWTGRGRRKSCARRSAGSRGWAELQGVECSSGRSEVKPSLTRRTWKSQTAADRCRGSVRFR